MDINPISYDAKDLLAHMRNEVYTPEGQQMVARNQGKYRHTIGVIKPGAFSVLRESDIEKPSKVELIAMINRPEWELTEDDVGLVKTMKPTVMFNFDAAKT